MNIKSSFVAVRWGEKSMISLYLSVLSGIVVALQYNPAEPLYSTTTIDLLVPFGAFWRSLHFYSSQLFFLLTITHLLAILIDRWPQPMTMRKWLPLICSLPVIVLLLFGGYVLRGDITGEMAGLIAENIVLSVPIIGRWLNELLFSVSTDGMMRVYPNHLIGLGILWGILSWDHIRKYRVSWRDQSGLVVLTLAGCCLIAAPMEIEQMGIFHINGPWFFIGLQELLRYAPPFWAGVVWPLTLVLALSAVTCEHIKCQRICLYYVLVWIILYVTFILV